MIIPLQTYLCHTVAARIKKSLINLIVSKKCTKNALVINGNNNFVNKDEKQ